MNGALDPQSRVALAAIAWTIGLALAGTPARAALDPPASGEAPPAPSAAPAPDANAPEIQPDAVSSFVTRTYRIKPAKLWKGLLDALTASCPAAGETDEAKTPSPRKSSPGAGPCYRPEDVDEAGMRVKTSFTDFEAKDYSEHVADPPPQITSTYQILQMVQVKQGKVSLEAIVAPGEGGTAVVSLRARILVQGLNRRTHVLVLADRRSSGVIEADFLEQLEETLHLKRV